MASEDEPSDVSPTAKRPEQPKPTHRVIRTLSSATIDRAIKSWLRVYDMGAATMMGREGYIVQIDIDPDKGLQWKIAIPISNDEDLE